MPSGQPVARETAVERRRRVDRARDLRFCGPVAARDRAIGFGVRHRRARDGPARCARPWKVFFLRHGRIGMGRPSRDRQGGRLRPTTAVGIGGGRAHAVRGEVRLRGRLHGDGAVQDHGAADGGHPGPWRVGIFGRGTDPAYTLPVPPGAGSHMADRIAALAAAFAVHVPVGGAHPTLVLTNARTQLPRGPGAGRRSRCRAAPASSTLPPGRPTAAGRPSGGPTDGADRAGRRRSRRSTREASTRRTRAHTQTWVGKRCAMRGRGGWGHDPVQATRMHALHAQNPTPYIPTVAEASGSERVSGTRV